MFAGFPSQITAWKRGIADRSFLNRDGRYCHATGKPLVGHTGPHREAHAFSKLGKNIFRIWKLIKTYHILSPWHPSICWLQSDQIWWNACSFAVDLQGVLHHINSRRSEAQSHAKNQCRDRRHLSNLINLISKKDLICIYTMLRNAPHSYLFQAFQYLISKGIAS